MYWLRAQPAAGSGRSPQLVIPGGQTLKTQPDGMWVTFSIPRGRTLPAPDFVDCIAIEACGTTQNFNDKRSRYAAKTSALLVDFDERWLKSKVSVQRGALRSRYELLGIDGHDSFRVPIRHLRVLYALPKDVYEVVRGDNVVLEGHEYVCQLQQLGQYGSQKVQNFLKSMAPQKHWSN